LPCGPDRKETAEGGAMKKKMEDRLTPEQLAAIKKDFSKWAEQFDDCALSPRKLYQRAFNMGLKIGGEICRAQSKK
jgi:hypothetical protein